MTNGGMNTLAAHGLEELFFQLCCCVCFLVLAGNRFWCYIFTYFEYNTVVAFFWFWREINFGLTYVLSAQYLCGCVSFLVVAENSSQNENTF